MAMTWGTILAGIGLVFGLPFVVILLNKRKRGLGWIALCSLVVFIIVGNVIETAIQR